MAHTRLVALYDDCSMPAAVSAAAVDDDVFALAETLIDSRRSVLPRHLVAPGPNRVQLDALLRLAAAAPDHGLLTPWRFIEVPSSQRDRLAETFAAALLDRDPAATPTEVAKARAKAYRAPLLLIAVACLGPRDPDIAPLERMISMGAALQNMLLGAHAMGFGAGLTGGQALASPRMRALCALADGEVAVCCVAFGTPTRRSLRAAPRPLPAQILSPLPAPAAVGSALSGA